MITDGQQYVRCGECGETVNGSEAQAHQCAPKRHRIDIHCGACGSRDVHRDADAAWNVKTQEWELVAVYDNATCEQCGGETNPIETKEA